MFDIAENKEKLKFVVGVSSGIYMVARSPELSSIVRKLGFALTRGTNAIELAGDVPHEIDYTQGKELRYIAEKQNLTLLFHGSLTVPMAMPERGGWRDAQDHIKKSIRSAVMGGCKYVNFHACLNYWLEMMTYAGRKLTMAFCDHEGKFISKILFESEKLREWFVKERWDVYASDILSRTEMQECSTKASVERGELWIRDERARRLEELNKRFIEKYGEGFRRILSRGPSTPEDELIYREYQKERENIEKDIHETAVREHSEKLQEYYQDTIKEKLAGRGKWDSEELRAVVGVIDGYHIMAHYLFYKKDPVWKEMASVYKDVIEKYKKVKFKPKDEKEEKEYTYPDGIYWLDGAWEKAERENDREFKEFYYAVCAAKYIEGHISKALEWMKDESPEGLIGSIRAEVKDEEEFKKLKKVAEELKITLEIPDARSPEYAGLYLIYRPKQIYATVKTIREQLKTNKLFMLIDFEHIATQGFDPSNEIREFVKLAPDAGKYILALHITKPTPLHHHIQVEIGDVEIYKLLWELTKVGLGKEHTTYLIFERGGERDPFKQSVTAIRLMVEQLNKGTMPENLIGEPKFFGVTGPALASEERQRVIIQEHARDPIEGLLVAPEEKYTALGKAATAKPGGAEKWKKEELT